MTILSNLDLIRRVTLFSIDKAYIESQADGSILIRNSSHALL